MSKRPKILVVEDDEMAQEIFGEWLKEENYQSSFALSAEQALSKVKSELFDTILLDVTLPGMSGLDLCKEIKKDPLLEHIPIIFISAHSNVKIAMQAMQLGAFYFLSKPPNSKELFLLIKRALETTQLRRELATLQAQLKKNQNTNIIGKSEQIQKVLDLVSKVAPHDASVLITGNSGTGKELVAKSIHEQSLRHKEPFVAIDCGALSESLLESELFGHLKGSFTHALKDRKGAFVEADGGTLFLDEIGNLPKELQIKLLRALEVLEIRPVGSDKTHKVDVRVLAATNFDLKQRVEEGHFREDLFYRLNVINIVLPNLRDRKEDIPLLAQHFLEEYGKGEVESFTAKAVRLMMSYNWPGNIRQLKNAVRYSCITVMGKEIEENDLPDEIQEKAQIAPNNLPPLYTLQELEKEYIIQVLRHTNYNQTQAAKILNIGRKSMWRKINRFDIELPYRDKSPAGDNQNQSVEKQ